jgi:hypothetical protein
MRCNAIVIALVLVATFGVGAKSQAAVVYSQNFEAPVTTQSASGGPGSFIQPTNSAGGSNWQVQGGTDGGAGGTVSATGGVDTNGVGGSQALFGNWNHSTAANFAFNQYTVYGLPGLPAGTSFADVIVSMDIFMSGSESSNTPVNVRYMRNDFAGERNFTPTLTNGQFTNVSFNLAQAGASGTAVDLTQSYHLRVDNGAGGFGFDANNIVRIDNVTVTVIPEPGLFAMAAIIGLSLSLRRGRRAV